ncbi:TetR/AcrR family transcriptional regulator [Dactylosporangium sp. CA-139066]|uniref:TetR/AcrR family transcriptional regulator n=1 Tax=Dactylosporangium sp. CA-139066 TaxID=3239930 RepID=UPI003D8AB1A0
MPRQPPDDRRTAIADAVIEVLASSGARGLTHRAVDAAAGLPAGSCSYYFRSREALLIAGARRIAELDMTGRPPTAPATVDDLAGLLTRLVWAQITADRRRTEARLHLSLEATRYPAVRAVLEELAATFTGAAVALLSALGTRHPRRDARAVLAVCQGIVFESTVSGRRPFTQPEIRAVLTDVLTARLPGPSRA